MRRSAIIAAGVLVAGGLVSGLAPASASAQCVAAGAQLKLGEGLFYPVIAVKSNVAILDFNIGGCTGSGTLFSASCGNSNGEVTINGASAAIATAGGAVVITGGANGAGIAVPDAANGESCATGSGADVFLITGVVNV